MPRLIAMVSNGLLDLTRYRMTAFPLAGIGDAIAHAAATSGPFDQTVIRF